MERVPLVRLRLLVYGVVIVMLLLVTGLVIFEWHAWESSRRTLPDGSQVILRGVNYGLVHRYPTGNFWQRLAFSLFPAKYTSRLPSLLYNETNDGPTLVLWIEHVGASAGRKTWYGNLPEKQVLFDDSGFVSGAYSFAVATRTNSFLQEFVFHALPSGSRELHLRFVCTNATDHWSGNAIFTFPNPAYQPGGSAYSSYPHETQQGRLKLVLNEFCPEIRDSLLSGSMAFSFDLLEDGHLAPDWDLHNLEVLDLRGAVYRPPSSGWGRKDGHIGGSFAGRFGTNSPWKLRFILKPVSFSSNEICTIKGISIGVGFGAKTNLAVVPFNGTTLVVQRGENGADLEAKLSPATTNYYMNLQDVPSANSLPAYRGTRYYMGQTDTNYLLGFPPDVTNVDLTFGVTRKVFIEVTAQPTP